CRRERVIAWLAIKQFGELLSAHVPGLGTAAGCASCEDRQPLIDRRLHSDLVREHHDFAIEIVRLDVSGATMQRLPGRATSGLGNSWYWLHLEAGCPGRRLLRFADISDPCGIEHAASLAVSL